MRNIIKTIIDSLESGENAISIMGHFGKGDVGRLAKQIKAAAKGRDVFVKDMTPYYYGHASKSRREECRKFGKNLLEDSLHPSGLKSVYCLLEDGTIGVKLIQVPFYVVVINCETINKIRQKRELPLLSRFKQMEISNKEVKTYAK